MSLASAVTAKSDAWSRLIDEDGLHTDIVIGAEDLRYNKCLLGNTREYHPACRSQTHHVN